MSTVAAEHLEPRTLVRQIARRLRRRLARVPPVLARSVSFEVDAHCRQLLSGGLEPEVAARLIAELTDDLTREAAGSVKPSDPAPERP